MPLTYTWLDHTGETGYTLVNTAGTSPQQEKCETGDTLVNTAGTWPQQQKCETGYTLVNTAGTWPQQEKCETGYTLVNTAGTWPQQEKFTLTSLGPMFTLSVIAVLSIRKEITVSHPSIKHHHSVHNQQVLHSGFVEYLYF